MGASRAWGMSGIGCPRHGKAAGGVDSWRDEERRGQQPSRRSSASTHGAMPRDGREEKGNGHGESRELGERAKSSPLDKENPPVELIRREGERIGDGGSHGGRPRKMHGAGRAGSRGRRETRFKRWRGGRRSSPQLGIGGAASREGDRREAQRNRRRAASARARARGGGQQLGQGRRGSARLLGEPLGSFYRGGSGGEWLALMAAGPGGWWLAPR